MDNGLMAALIAFLGVPVSIVVTWMVNRRKNVADVYNTIADGSQHAVDSMKTSMDALHERLEYANEKIAELILEGQIMQKELKELRGQNILLIEENHILHSKIDELIRSTHPLPKLEENPTTQN